MQNSSSYEYRLERFRRVKDSWGLELVHALFAKYHMPKHNLKDLRDAVSLYIARALQFPHTYDEDQLIQRINANRDNRTNITPNGGVVPKCEYQLEYNMVLRAWTQLVRGMIKDDVSLLRKFRLTPNIRIKFAKELEDNMNRGLNTSHPHSDAWVEGGWGMNCFVPIFGDCVGNTLEYYVLKDESTFSDSFLEMAETYTEMQWVLDYYELSDTVIPEKGYLHLSDYALIHNTRRDERCETRVSIDTTIFIGDHDLHDDRRIEYLETVPKVGEEILITTNRSIYDPLREKKLSFLIILVEL